MGSEPKPRGNDETSRDSRLARRRPAGSVGLLSLLFAIHARFISALESVAEGQGQWLLGTTTREHFFVAVQYSVGTRDGASVTYGPSLCRAFFFMARCAELACCLWTVVDRGAGPPARLAMWPAALVAWADSFDLLYFLFFSPSSIYFPQLIFLFFRPFPVKYTPFILDRRSF